jgi:formylglycine-generating enzyme required for sulfatase activity
MQQPSDTVRLIRIFVSSPGDVAEEREVLGEAIQRINDTQGQTHSVRLELWKWECQVVPQIGPPPQAVVDAQTPAYDVYLGIMSSRFGTPTPTHGSGTEKELRDAVKRRGKNRSPWILFYFNEKPTLSAKPADVRQYLKVCTFREELKKLGIVGSYTGVRGSDRAFFEHVQQDLRLLIQNHLQPLPPPAQKKKSTNAPPSPASKQPPVVPPAYRGWLKRHCASLDLELRRKEGHAVRLNNVYVPLTTLAGRRDSGTKKNALDRDAEQNPQLLLDLLGAQSLYISGAAGTGKSTFCRWVAWLACEGAVPAQDVEPPEEYAERFPESLGNRLPLLVRLRDCWNDHLPKTPGRRELSKVELTRALESWITATRPGDLEWAVVKAHLDKGSTLLIVDGVDEVPLTHGEPSRPSSPRDMVLSGLAAAMPDWIRLGNRVLVTSRSYGVTEPRAETLGLLHAPIAELDAAAQNLLVRRWFHILADGPPASEAIARDMIDDVRGREGLQPLAANPLLLTAMCIVYSEGKRLPQDKYELYVRIVDNVLFSRYPKDPAVIDLVRVRLNVIAYGMHTGIWLDEPRVTPQALVTYPEIDRLMTTHREQSPWTEAGVKDAVATREDLLSHSGLLLPAGDRRAGFYHLSFQDFLAAQRLLDREGDGLLAVFESRAPFPEWRATLAFLFGAVLAASASPDRAIKLLEGLLARLTPQAVGLQVVVSACFEILIGRKIRPEHLEDQFRPMCLASIENEVQPVSDRAALALTLGKLGDARIVTDLRDPSAYVEVPAGDYLVGEDKRPYRLEKPILLRRYPVVNSQYALFMQDKGYENPQWWSTDGRQWLEAENERQPRYWGNGKWNGPSQPVVGVSYWEAEAFAAWAGGRLPSEWEWEAAARGPEGLQYPWGDDWIDEICNTREAGLGVTSPVGIFPRSRSKAFGLEDMAGNVWEWCSDFWSEQDRFVRVVRGGSWGYDSRLARAAYRYVSHPDDRNFVVGFRVVGVA